MKNSKHNITFLNGAQVKIVRNYKEKGEVVYLIPVNCILHKVFLIPYSKLFTKKDSLVSSSLFIPYELDKKYEFDEQ
jgi:hypothetical protein